MTHRMFSRNASSSRAIPTEALIEDALAEPLFWGKNKKGMQADEEIDTEVEIVGRLYSNKTAWAMSRVSAKNCARAFADAGYHKQIVNRLIEPFTFIHVLVTATEWDNFYALRRHPDAQPEIHKLADLMYEANISTIVTPRHPKEWHLPFVTREEYEENSLEDSIKVSVARCARLSYYRLGTDEKSLSDKEADLILFDRLLENGHLSPFEHQCTPMPKETPPSNKWWPGVTHMDRNGSLWSGNLRHFVQFRQLIAGDKHDSR